MPKKAVKKLFALLLMLLPVVSFADDLAELFNLAMQVDTTLLEAEQTQYATMELLPQARAELLPIVTATANTTYTYTNNPQILPYNTVSYGASMTQPLFNMASWYQYRQAGDQIKAAVAGYEDAKQELMLRVTTQYFAILKALDDVIFARSERIAFARLLEETHQKFNAGVIAITDVNEAQAKYDGARSQEIRAEYALSNQKEKMGEITGIPADAVNTLKYNIALQNPNPNNMEYWVDTSVKQNFGLLSKRYTMEAAKKNISIQRAGHYPTVEAAGTVSKAKSVPPAQVMANTNSVGVTLTLPLYTGGRVNSLTRQAQYEYEVSKQQAIATERDIISNVRQAFRGVLTQISQINALQQSVISSKSALDATQAAFEVGTRTIVDVLNSQTDLLSAKTELSKARYDYILASFNLKRYAGILSAEDINIINSWLQKPATDANSISVQK